MSRKPLIRRILFSAVILAVYGFGKDIPLHNADIYQVTEQLKEASFLQITSLATGGNFTAPTIFSLGLAPWMAGMIFWQLLTLTKMGGIDQMPKEKSDRWRNLLILLIAVIEGYGTTYMLRDYFSDFTQFQVFQTCLLIVAGAFFLIWLASMNTVYGLGGPSLVILFGMVSSYRVPVAQITRMILVEDLWGRIVLAILVGVIVLGLIALALIFERSEYRLPVNRIMNTADMQKSAYIPLKLNAGGSLAFMFSLTVLLLPQIIFQYLADSYPQNNVFWWLENNSTTTSFFGVTLYNVILFALAVLFAQVMLDVTDLTENLRKNGDYFTNIRPGKETKKYLKQKQNATAFIGATFTVIVAGLPLYLGVIWPEYAAVVLMPGLTIILVGIITSIIVQIRAINTLSSYEKLL